MSKAVSPQNCAVNDRKYFPFVSVRLLYLSSFNCCWTLFGAMEGNTVGNEALGKFGGTLQTGQSFQQQYKS